MPTPWQKFFVNGYAYNVLHCDGIFRIVCHYDESRGSFVCQQTIMTRAEKCGLPRCDRYFLGRVIACVWNGRAARSRSTFTLTSGYMNIKPIGGKTSTSRVVR